MTIPTLFICLFIRAKYTDFLLLTVSLLFNWQSLQGNYSRSHEIFLPNAFLSSTKASHLVGHCNSNMFSSALSTWMPPGNLDYITREINEFKVSLLYPVRTLEWSINQGYPLSRRIATTRGHITHNRSSQSTYRAKQIPPTTTIFSSHGRKPSRLIFSNYRIRNESRCFINTRQMSQCFSPTRFFKLW